MKNKTKNPYYNLSQEEGFVSLRQSQIEELRELLWKMAYEIEDILNNPLFIFDPDIFDDGE